MDIDTEHIMRNAAFEYLSQWHQTDSSLMANIVLEDNLRKRGDAFSKLATKYQVVRSFPVKAIRTAEGEAGVAKRWQTVAASVIRVKIDDGNETTSADKVHALARRLGQIFSAEEKSEENPVLISAATKFLWFAGNTSIRIYDKRAVDALNKLHGSGRVNGDYAAYAKAWDAEFESRKKMVKEAIEGSIESIDSCAIPVGPARRLAIQASKKDWYRDRVFDKFLWKLGAKKQDGALKDEEKNEQLRKLLVLLEA